MSITKQTLQALHDRLSTAVQLGLSAREAYDSFYQEMVGAALSSVEGEPVAFAKDGVLFWHGDHAARRGTNRDLFFRPQPAQAAHWTESEPVRLASHRAGHVYVAGPMSGLPEFNFPAFNAEAAKLRAEGLSVLNPAEHGIVDGADWADYLRHDIAGLASCERIHLLPGWSKSKGARLEHSIAVALGMVITFHPDAEPAQAEAAQGGRVLDVIERFGPAFTALTDRLQQIGGCTDGGCQVVKPKGMHTNGGCRCLTDRHVSRQVVFAYQKFSKAIADGIAAASQEQAPYRVDDEAQLRTAISVMDDVLTDIDGWEDQALAQAVRASRADLLAMADSIKFMAASQEQAQQPEWPKLEKPARVGGGTFGVGVSARLVVEAAQRAQEYMAQDKSLTPAELQEQERSRRAMWDMLHGSPDEAQQPAQATHIQVIPVIPDDLPAGTHEPPALHVHSGSAAEVSGAQYDYVKQAVTYGQQIDGIKISAHGTSDEEWEVASGAQQPAQAEAGAVGECIKALAVQHLGTANFVGMGDFVAAVTALQSAQAVGEDTKRLDALRDNSWDLRCFDIPTGGGDADIGWRVIAHHMDKPVERVVGEAFKDDPRAAIDAALANQQGASNG